MSSITDLRVRTRTTYTKIDPNAKVRDNPTLDFFINSAYEKVQEDMQFDIPECQWNTTITTVSGAQEYDKPTDMVRVNNIFESSYNMTPISKSDSMRLRAEQSNPSSYYLYGSKIGVYPTPDNTYTLDILYSKYLPKITDTQESLLPADYDEAIALYASYLAMLSVEKQAKANILLSQYTTKSNGLFGRHLYDDSNITFGIQRSSNNGRDDVY